MSLIKVNRIENEAGTVGFLVEDLAELVEPSLKTTTNLLYNGHMQINQENFEIGHATRDSGWAACYDTYVAELKNDLGEGGGTVAQAKDGLENVIRVDVIDGATDPEAPWDMIAPILGCNMLYDSQGDFMTLSFDFKSNVVSDTFGFGLVNWVAWGMPTPPSPTPADCYYDQFSYQTSNVKQRISVTFPVPSQSEWSVPLPNTRDVWGMMLGIVSKFRASTNTPLTNKGVWTFGKNEPIVGAGGAGEYYGLSTDEWWGSTPGKYIEVSNVKLERGQVATPNLKLNYAEDLRDVQTQYNRTVGWTWFTHYTQNTGTAYGNSLSYPERMSGVPAVILPATPDYASFVPPTGTPADSVGVDTLTQENFTIMFNNSLVDWVAQEVGQSGVAEFIIDSR